MVDKLKTEDGILLPKGSDVSMLTFSIQTDGELFDDPFNFDPFRYSRIREAIAAVFNIPEHKDRASSLSFISTDSRYLPFGHGKQPCPGRYLVDFELKMTLAYVLLYYRGRLMPNGKKSGLSIQFFLE
jgi:cytochrome P450